jgi:hypothetical protein
MEAPDRFSLKSIIQNLTYESHNKLCQLTSQLAALSPNDRKQRIYDYIHQTHERFVRLLVLLRWIKKHKKMFDELDQFTYSMMQNTLSLQWAANNLLFVCTRIKNMFVPVYDLPTAIDVLTTGTYERLPLAIEVTMKLILL